MSLLDYLPAIYQDPDDRGAPAPEAGFLRHFLLAFESVMLSRGPEATPATLRADSRDAVGSGRPDLFAGPEHTPAPVSGRDFDGLPLEDQIANRHLLFDAWETPKRFLAWLASWVALALRPDLSPFKQRRILANAVRLYRIRGTRLGLEESLHMYLDVLASVDDGDLPPLQIAVHSTVGVDTYLGGGASFLFQVTLAFPREDPEFVEQQTRLAREVIELGRPAHTRYVLRRLYPRFRLGHHSTVGVDTVLAP
jgi:phage tail-like protein